MADLTQSSRVMPASMLLIFVAAGTLLMVDEPFQISRPGHTPTNAIIATPSEEFVDGRLWQDPLQPVYDDWQTIVDGVPEDPSSNGAAPYANLQRLPQTIRDFRLSVQQTLASNNLQDSRCGNAAKLLILPVMLQGGNYSNQVELRRRTRYAIVAALTSFEFAPDSGSKLGYFVAPRAGPFEQPGATLQSSRPSPGHPVVVGYEWFHPRKMLEQAAARNGRCDEALATWRRIAVLWLNENDFGFNPMARLDSLLTFIAQSGNTKSANSDIAIRIIGPTSSQVLVEINDEAERYSRSGGPPDYPKQDVDAFVARGHQFTVEHAIQQFKSPFVHLPTAEQSAAGGNASELVLLANDYLRESKSDQQTGQSLLPCATALLDNVRGPGFRDQISQASRCLHDALPGADSNDYVEELSNEWWMVANSKALDERLKQPPQSAPDPLVWREVRSIYYEAQSYLDYGLPANIDLGESTACLSQELQSDYSSRSVLARRIAACLRDHIEPNEESDTGWAASIARIWTGKLAADNSDSAALAVRLLQQMHVALDDGIPYDVDRQSLARCIQGFLDNYDPNAESGNRKRANECFDESPSFTDLKDSDNNWKDHLIDRWTDDAAWRTRLTAARHVVDRQLRTPLIRSDAVRLIANTYDYLEQGLPDDVQFDPLVACIDGAISENLGKAGQLSSAIAACLSSQISSAQDTWEPDWQESVADNWISRSNLRSVTQAVNETRAIFSALTRTEIFSPRSTMPLRFISGLDAAVGDDSYSGDFRNSAQLTPDQRFLKRLRDGGIPISRFISTITRDHETAAVLIEELRLRGLFQQQKQPQTCGLPEKSSCIEELGNEPDQIAVIFEMDSDYGRLLPLMLDCYIKQAYAKSDKAGEEFSLRIREDPCSWSSVAGSHAALQNKVYVHSFGYMAGIDGEVMDKGAIKAATSASASGSDPRQRKIEDIFDPPVGLEPPVGRSQLDYLRRLSDRIRKFDEKLRATTNGRGLRAVGVFGSDIYDKQLILQALHRSLPNTVFFTTDLDARLSHPGQYEWNQNLLVGSAYGLDLRENLFASYGRTSTPVTDTKQNPETETTGENKSTVSTGNDSKPEKAPLSFNLHVEMPPLRDNYQTATFLSAKLALLDRREHELQLFGRYFTPPKPRLFEIGRSGAIDITRVSQSLDMENLEADCPDTKAAIASESSYQLYDACIHGTLGWTQHAAQAKHQKVIKALALLLPLVIMLLAWIRQLSVLERTKQTPEWTSYLIATGIAFASAATLFIWLLTWNDPSREPWLLFDGISAIPTFALRMIIITYAACTIVTGYGRLRQNNLNLAQRFELKSDIATSWRGFKLTQPTTWFELSTVAWRKEINQATRHGGKHNASADEIWKRYRELGKAPARLLRTVSYALIVTALTYLWYFSVLREHALVRGLSVLDNAVVLIMSFAIIIIVFLTTDAMRMCQVFIHALSRYDVHWTRDEKDKVFNSLGLHSETYDRLRCIDMITYRTEVITPMIILPFMLILLLLVARSTLLDGWEWNPPLITIYIALSIHLLVRSFLLQREAEQARDRILIKLNRLKNHLLHEFQDGQKELGTKHINQVDNVMQYILELKRGAFVPWFRHPIVQAILVPFSGLGTLALLEAFV